MLVQTLHLRSIGVSTAGGRTSISTHGTSLVTGVAWVSLLLAVGSSTWSGLLVALGLETGGATETASVYPKVSNTHREKKVEDNILDCQFSGSLQGGTLLWGGIAPGAPMAAVGAEPGVDPPPSPSSAISAVYSESNAVCLF